MNRPPALGHPAIAILLFVAVAAATLPVARAGAAGNAVTDGGASAAIIGVVTRIPAEITGGALYASSSVTVDKARARASGFYGGELVDAFLRSSLEQYGPLNDELDATAENPEQSSPDEEVVGDSPDTGNGRGAYLRAAAPSPTEAEAIFTAASDSGGEDAPIFFDASTAESSTRVLDDDTVVSESIATVTGLVVAGVVEFASVRSVARVTVPVGGEPETTFETTFSGVSVDGTEVAGLGEDGITVGGQNVVDNLKFAELDPVFAALAEQGLTFESVPTEITSETGRGSVEGAAFRFRYEAKKNPTAADLLSDNPIYQFVPLPPELGYDEEFLVGHVRANAVSREAADLGIDLGFGGTDDLGLPVPTTPGADPAAGDAALSTGAPSSESSAPTVTTPPATATSDVPSPTTEEPAVAAPADGGGAPGSADTLDLLGANAASPGVDRMVDLYQLLFLFAIAGAAVPSLLRRAHS